MTEYIAAPIENIFYFPVTIMYHFVAVFIYIKRVDSIISNSTLRGHEIANHLQRKAAERKGYRRQDGGVSGLRFVQTVATLDVCRKRPRRTGKIEKATIPSAV